MKRWWVVAQGLLALAFAGVVIFGVNHGADLLLLLFEGYLVVSGALLLAYAAHSRVMVRKATRKVRLPAV